MIVRVRLADGSTLRVNVEGSDAIQVLAERIHATGRILGEFSLFLDASAGQGICDSSMTVEEYGLKNGDFVYIRGGQSPGAEVDKVESAAPNGSALTHEAERPTGDKRTSKCVHGPRGVCGYCLENQVEDGNKNGKSRCLHGQNAMCDKCAPSEDAHERFEAELKRWKDRKGTSISVMEAQEALKFKVKSQEEGHVKAASVDHSSAKSFQGYLAQTHFNQQRFGYLYGTLNDDGVAKIEAIYEPPQVGTEEAYAPADPADAGDMSERAGTIADLLGLRRIGLIVSAKPRKAILSGPDVLFAAKLRAEEEAALGAAAASAFVILVVSLAEDGQTLFEAYQISDQCLQMYKKDVFAPMSEQKPNSGRIRTQAQVLVEAKEVSRVHTEFFLVNIPIRDHHSWLRSDFPVENRELRPQIPSDVKLTLNKAKSDPFYRQVSDFHLLLFLSNLLDLGTDMPGLLDIVRHQREPSVAEEGYQVLVESIT